MRTTYKDIEIAKGVLSIYIEMDTRAKVRQMARDRNVPVSAIARELVLAGIAVLEAQAATPTDGASETPKKKVAKRARGGQNATAVA